MLIQCMAQRDLLIPTPAHTSSQPTSCSTPQPPASFLGTISCLQYIIRKRRSCPNNPTGLMMTWPHTYWPSEIQSNAMEDVNSQIKTARLLQKQKDAKRIRKTENNTCRTADDIGRNALRHGIYDCRRNSCHMCRIITHKRTCKTVRNAATGISHENARSSPKNYHPCKNR